MTLTGYAAIEYAEANNLPLCKYNDPTESAREDLTPDEARAVAREDARLIYVEAKTYADAYPDSKIPAIVKGAIRHANWFSEEDDRLRDLASSGNAAEIRQWANEIRSDWDSGSEDGAYWHETANEWDRVAEAIDALKASL